MIICAKSATGVAMLLLVAGCSVEQPAPSGPSPTTPTRPAATTQPSSPSAPPSAPPDAASSTVAALPEEIGQYRIRLAAMFDEQLAEPSRYQRRVRRECRQFPEGDLFPYLLVGHAYAHIAMAEPSRTASARDKMVTLIDLALPVVAQRAGAPGGDLMGLKSYRRQATYLGQLNLMLGRYRQVTRDDRYLPLQRHLSALLHEAVQSAGGRPLESFPSYTWSFDTIPALLSLKLYDDQSGSARSAQVIRAHLDWLREHATDPATKLPFSRVDPRSGAGLDPPRGCELSWRVALQSELDGGSAKQLYDRYVASFWRDGIAVRGFAEWPQGQERAEDSDSGPIFMGVGSAATALGIAATLAMGDEPKQQALAVQMRRAATLLPSLASEDPKTGKLTIAGMLPYDAKYVSGSLFGDVVLFYAVSWPSMARPGGKTPGQR